MYFQICNFGFRSKRSTATALSGFADEVLLNMEKGNICGVLFLDLSEAFDAVDYGILMSKLSSVGVSPRSLEWFSSYLSNRNQQTSCDNKLSEALPVTFGFQHSEVSSYADDAVLYCFAKEPREHESKLNSGIYNATLWLKANRLTLKLSKTKSILMGSNR